VSDILAIVIQLAVLVSVVISIVIQVRTQTNVRKVEIATNSMKDALVAATERSAGLEGEARGRAQEQARNAT
jgi:hypothetical protein